MQTAVNVILVALLTIAFSASLYATESGSMICKGGIVSIGDTAGEVLSKCGQPATSTRREQKKVADGSKLAHDWTVVAVSIDDWLFNFGPNEFQYQLVLENGRVAKIDSLGYGY